ncbi:hypothetical protein MHU86_1276 [Fragilaria crotonensis]|nr:hypothetical protein MHU86_1276 [Fragilaria crotonensis]
MFGNLRKVVSAVYRDGIKFEFVKSTPQQVGDDMCRIWVAPTIDCLVAAAMKGADMASVIKDVSYKTDLETDALYRLHMLYWILIWKDSRPLIWLSEFDNKEDGSQNPFFLFADGDTAGGTTECSHSRSCQSIHPKCHVCNKELSFLSSKTNFLCVPFCGKQKALIVKHVATHPELQVWNAFHSTMWNTKKDKREEKTQFAGNGCGLLFIWSSRKDAFPDSDAWLNNWTLTKGFYSFGLAMPLLCCLENPNSFPPGNVTLHTGFLIRTSSHLSAKMGQLHQRAHSK